LNKPFEPEQHRLGGGGLRRGDGYRRFAAQHVGGGPTHLQAKFFGRRATGAVTLRVVDDELPGQTDAEFLARRFIALARCLAAPFSGCALKRGYTPAAKPPSRVRRPAPLPHHVGPRALRPFDRLRPY